jgi:hypothetical protein
MTPPPTSTAAERRARAQNFLEGLGSRAVHGATDRAFNLAGVLLDAGHAKIANAVRAGAQKVEAGDRAGAEREFTRASELAQRENLPGAKARIDDIIDAEFTVLE